MYALDALTGSQIWQNYENYIFDSPPAVCDGVVYISNFAINASTGAQIWRFSEDSNAAPAISNGVLYISAYNGYFYAIGESDNITPNATPTTANVDAKEMILIVIFGLVLITILILIMATKRKRKNI